MPRGAQPGFCCLKWLFCPDASCLHPAQFAEALGRDVKGPISCQDVQRMRQLPSCRDRLRVSDLWGRGVSLLAVFRSAWVGEATLRGDSHLFHWEIASQNNRLLHLERNLMVRWEKRSLIPSTSPVVPPPLQNAHRSVPLSHVVQQPTFCLLFKQARKLWAKMSVVKANV